MKRLIFVCASKCYPEIEGSRGNEYSLNVYHPVVCYVKNVTNKIPSTLGTNDPD
jgi:hypothetical protein